MSFAVIHMQKFKSGAIGGIQNHNERLKVSQTNPDIDYAKSDLNVDLREEDNRTYQTRVKDRIKELDLSKAVRKDAVTMCGFVCTSDSEYFSNLTQDEQNKYFKDSYEFLKNRYGEENIVAAAVHFDETTPHLHCYIVPVTNDGRLSAKDVFTRSELRNLQTDFAEEVGQKHGLERGKEGSGLKHLSEQRFKLEMAKQQEQQALSNVKESKQVIEAMYETLKSHDLVPEAQDRLSKLRTKDAEKVNKAPSKTKSWDMER